MKTIIITLAVFTGVIFFVGFQSPAEGKDQVHRRVAELSERYEVATFAGGCFWCTEADFEKVPGVIDAISGYTGGHDPSPSYKSVSSGTTGHTEAVQVFYDPGVVTYEKLLEVFWRNINPTDAGGQFVDRGSQYRPEIFYHNETQRKLAAASRTRLENAQIFEKPIATPITPFEKFFPAEPYHQDYYKKNAMRYKYYRWGSGRDQFLGKYWKDGKMIENKESGMKNNEQTEMMKETGNSMMNNENKKMMKTGDQMKNKQYTKPDMAVLKDRLTPLQYKVTQKDGTERAFANEYWDNKEDGIYVDIVSGEPLFSSTDKFKSGTGWPSFTRPLEPGHVVEKKDKSLFMVRTEVRSKYGDSHLGHVFDDGPPPTGLRYCINSAALRFIPKQDLEKEGYGQYMELF